MHRNMLLIFIDPGICERSILSPSAFGISETVLEPHAYGVRCTPYRLESYGVFSLYVKIGLFQVA